MSGQAEEFFVDAGGELHDRRMDGLSVRAWNVLRAHRVTTLEALARYEERILLAEWANCGPQTVAELRHLLRRYGMDFVFRPRSLSHAQRVVQAKRTHGVWSLRRGCLA